LRWRFKCLDTVALCFVYYYDSHRVLRSFPTRRSSDLFSKRLPNLAALPLRANHRVADLALVGFGELRHVRERAVDAEARERVRVDRKSTRLNSSHLGISYAVFCLKKKSKTHYAA